jgi:CDP-paratose 2-epimerase
MSSTGGPFRTETPARQPGDTSMGSPTVVARRPVLVTGGAGFIGCNLADRLAGEGHDVVIFDALARDGVERNLDWLRYKHPRRISAVIGDVRDSAAVAEVVKGAAAVFHLAAQVAVTKSLDDPLSDFDVNVRGTLDLLEAIRRSPAMPPLVYASTNKVYGDLSDLTLASDDTAYWPENTMLRAEGVDERRRLDFHTPYGCSKGAADQYVLDYARSFGLPATVFRMSCIYGPHQMGTEDQGWVAHFALRALAGEPITLYGDGRQVRDLLEVSDVVAAYIRAFKRIGAISGRAFNIGGGPANAVSLRQVIRYLEDLTGRRIEIERDDWRPGDQLYYVSDTRAATAALDLSPPRPWRSGIADLVDWLRENVVRSRRGVTGAAMRAEVTP